MDKNLYNLTHGIYVLGSKDGNRPVGSLIDAAIMAALKPKLIVFSCLNTSYTKACIEKCGEVNISVLGKDADPFIIANFGYQSSRNANKWDFVDYHIFEEMPALDNCLSVVKCKIVNKITVDSHTIFISEIVKGDYYNEGTPMTYLDYQTSLKEKAMKFLPQIRNKLNK